MNKKIHRPIFDRRRERQTLQRQASAIKVLALSFLFLFSALRARADGVDMQSEFSSEEATIELDLKADPYTSYKQRRTDWSKRFSLGVEVYSPHKYISPADQSTYSQILGSNSVQIAQLNMGTQYNTRIGGFFLDLFYGAGQASRTSTRMGVSKYGVSAGLFLDTMFENPYVSPYFSGQYFAMDWIEASPANSILIGGNVTSMSYQVGFSLHLNKLDTLSSGAAYAEYGLKNSFLDLYATQVLSSSASSGASSGSSTNPDFSSDMNYGMNFRLEF